MLTLNVQDMTCNHCASAITRAVKEVDADATIDVQVAEKRVHIDSKLAAPVLLMSCLPSAFGGSKARMMVFLP